MVGNMAHSPLLVVSIVKSRVASHVCQSRMLLAAVPGMAEVEARAMRQMPEVSPEVKMQRLRCRVVQR